jgi:ATP phosphoribosyltransferase regulatory subunit
MLYKLPQGTERLLLDDAFRRQKIVRSVQDLFTSWGYRPVQTPVIDFFDLYKPFLESASDQVYRLVDRDGELLMLRSDMTLFLAHSVGASVSEGHTPLRLCYTDTILRHEHSQDISENEFFQIGAEFIGSSSPEGDQEILLLLNDILDKLGLKEAQIHIGSRALFTALTQGWSDTEKEQLQAAVLYRQTTATGKISTDALKLFHFIGRPADAKKFLKTLVLSPEVLSEANKILEIVSELASIGSENRFLVDFSEIGKWSYYTGLVFQVYYPDVGDAVASGGRYDALLSYFGLKSPSVGFSLSLRKIEPYAQTGSLAQDQLVAQGNTLAERLDWAQKERSQGKIVLLQGVRP